MSELPTGWASCEVGDVVRLEYGKGLSKKQRDGGQYPVYGSNGAVGRHSVALIDAPAIIVARKGSIGSVHVAQQPSWPIDTTYFVREFHDQPATYWAHQLRALDLARLNRATAIPGVNREDVHALRITLPPLNEQRRIVAKIEALTTRSRRAKEALDAIPPLLERFRQSVLAAAFRGDLTADWRKQNPGVEPASELLKRIRKERRRRWEESYLEKMRAKGKEPKDDKWKAKYKEPEPVDESGLPELPAGWCWASVEQTAENIVDCPHSTPKWSDAGFMCVRTTEFRPGHLDLSGVRYVDEDTYTQRTARLRPLPGDILYSREGGILGIACQVPEQAQLCLGQRMMLIRPAAGVASELVMHYLNAPRTLARVRSLTGGSASPHLNVRDIRAFPVALPPRAEQRALADRIAAAMAGQAGVADMIATSTLRCGALDQSILARAFRGELVPQDPNDEPASVLLERIRAERAAAEASKPKKKRGRRGKKKAAAATTPRSSAPEDDEDAEDDSSPTSTLPHEKKNARASPKASTSTPTGANFSDLELDEQLERVHRLLLGLGMLEKDSAVRTAAAELRQQDLLQYKRLRKDGDIYASILNAINNGVTLGWFDRPKRGHVRAIVSDSKEYTREQWREVLLQVVDGEPMDRDEVVRLVAEEARNTMGLEFKRLRTGGTIDQGVRSAMNSAIRRGELEKLGARDVRRSGE